MWDLLGTEWDAKGMFVDILKYTGMMGTEGAQISVATMERGCKE